MKREASGIVVFLSVALEMQAGAGAQCFDERLTAPGGLSNDDFGNAVAWSGDWMAVGAPGADVDGDPTRPDAGLVFLYKRGAGGWEYHSTLKPDDWKRNIHFGMTLVMDGDRLLVSADWWYRDDVAEPKRGAAYAFRRDGDAWVQEARLEPADGRPGDFFGWGLAIEGNRAVVGAVRHDVDGVGATAGAAYIFEHDGTAWRQAAALSPSDLHAEDNFGGPIAIEGDLVAVRAAFADGTKTDQGAVYLFRRGTDGSWSQEAKLVPSDPQPQDYFGYPAIHNGRVAIGAPWHNVSGKEDRGVIYLFERKDGAWTQTDRLLPGPGAAGDMLGWPVTLTDNALVAGANNAYSPWVGSGQVYIYRLLGGKWSRQRMIDNPESSIGGNFGISLAINDQLEAVIGARANKGERAASGAAYTMPLEGADCDSDGDADVNDFVCFQQRWRDREAYADWNHDGSYSVNDFVAYQAGWRSWGRGSCK